MLGTRGVPVIYGGFERCAEELGARLAARGHSVTVYCRRHFVDPGRHAHRGMRLITLPTIENKYLDTLVHTLLGSLHALTRPYDICLYFIAGNSPVTWIPRLAGKRTVLNVDGLDWKRQKWPPPAKAYIRLAERLATILPTAALTDSGVVQRYYRRRYGAQIACIAYGSEVEPLPPGERLRALGLAQRGYVLFVGRIVPENNVLPLIEAWRRVERKRGLKLVVVGAASYADDYVARAKAAAGQDVTFTGYLAGDAYREVLSSPYLFVESSSASGTHPALLEAMSCGNCVLVHATPENLETMGGAGLVYNGQSAPAGNGLRQALQRLLDSPALVESYREQAAAHARAHYSWDAVTEQYLALFYSLVEKRGDSR